MKEAGDYTFFAAVASANATSSFQMSLDGEELTDVISVPKNEGEDNYDDYGYVKQNVTLKAGEHILRMTVTSSWFDVDYFSFTKGKDAEEPDLSENTSLLKTVRMQVPTGVQKYRIFDINGSYIGKVQASNLQELRLNASNLVKRGGAYLARSSTGATLRIQIVK